jgi:hypothetical protein
MCWSDTRQHRERRQVPHLAPGLVVSEDDTADAVNVFVHDELRLSVQALGHGLALDVRVDRQQAPADLLGVDRQMLC